MGRPTKLTKTLQEEICACLEAGAHRRFAAGKVGIDEATFSRWYHRGAAADDGAGPERLYRNFFLAVNRAEAAFALAGVETLKSGAAHNPKLIQFLLSRRYPSEYGRRDNVEQVSPEDKAAQAASLRQLLIERLEKLAPEKPEEAEPPAAEAPPDAE